jgi:hypothetical protein
MYGKDLLGFVLMFIKNLLIARTLVLKIRLHVVAYLFLAILLKDMNGEQVKTAFDFFTMPKALVVNYELKFT